MMRPIRFLSLNQVITIHKRMITEFGGGVAIRDHGLLESAVIMPRAKFDGQFLHDDLPAMAAAYLFHLCKNHAFVDGNKRTALASAEVFLLINDMTLTSSNEAVEKLTLGVADGSINKKDVTAFFKENTESNSPSI